MRRPVTKPAHVLHEIVHAAILVLPQENPDRVVEIKRCPDGHRSDGDADEPVKNRCALHKQFSSGKFCHIDRSSKYPGMSDAAGFLDFVRNDVYEMLAGN